MCIRDSVGHIRRRRMAGVVCSCGFDGVIVHPKRAHKQEKHIFPTYFAFQGSHEGARESPPRPLASRCVNACARFPPFGFAIAEISSNSNEDVSFCGKDLLWPDSDRGRSVSPLRFRYSRDKL